MPKAKPGKKLSQRKSTRRSVRDAGSQPSPVDLATDVDQVFSSTQSPAAGSSASTSNGVIIIGCRLRRKKRSPRYPVSHYYTILKSILNSLTHVCVNTYDLALFRAAFLIAFFGFLRVGEFTSRSRHEPVPLSEKDVIIQGMGNQAKLRIMIAKSKTDQTRRGCSILLPQNVFSYLCPLRAVNDYLALRTLLRRAITFCGLPLLTSFHSFRIGAATSAAMAGVSDVCIQNMGRWASNTHRLYIRQPVPP
ncbi:uncharacterized protein LOC121419602 [Lytechinus variegatus]|uniref:uncharacterized protein LOC121419602 n=1 Tax=Lytechinus variegatus TaxID=7654 RepID=UPI001BB1370D|nr:uncharacterized protein LOC121419602 [Lytechinus variegatus]